MALLLREATRDDLELLYAWRNDPTTRLNSFRQEEVDRDEHRRWLETKLLAPDRARIWILMEDGVPVGQVRYDRNGESADISVSIDDRFRGRGLGTAILRMSAPRACRDLGVSELRGMVKLDNAASMAAFVRAGFRRGADSVINGERAAVFLWAYEGR
jgi:UDP-2,4-diacetamido-2,4,6-trideoxy-beta-L-altropyranose hydrolase